MWHVSLLRFIRRRLVLAAIFFFSLTYFLFHLGGTFKLDSRDPDFEVKREHPLIWQTSDKNSTANEIDGQCRNSVQGRFLIVDERGFVCSRFELLESGCCNVESSTTKHFSCDTCNPSDCCAIYEYCVSCCLHPDKKTLLEKVMENASRRQMTVFASVKDNYELCLAKCRTDSHSVQNENRYRDPKAKHCYGETQAHESQRDVNENSAL